MQIDSGNWHQIALHPWGCNAKFDGRCYKHCGGVYTVEFV